LRDFLIGVLLVLTAPVWLLLLLINPHWRSHVGERFSFTGGDVDLWLHGASMGEIIGVEEFLKRFHQKFPKQKIVVTANTSTGRAAAKKRFPFAHVQLAPFDWGPVVKKWMKSCHPKLHLLSELDLWPARQALLNSMEIPTIVLGARLSERGFRRSQKVWGLLQEAYDSVVFWGAREEAVANRLKKLGIAEDKIEITGPLKYDMLLTETTEPLNSSSRIDPSFAVVLAGSVHPSEEKPFIELYQQLGEDEKLQIILAPRHPNKLSYFVQELENNNCPYVLWSENKPMPAKGFLLLDQMGVLSALYEKAQLAFVGGTLVDLGGHNVLEPARFSVPVVVGPYTHHVKEEMTLLLKMQAVLQESDVLSTIKKLLQEPEKASRMGMQSKEVLKSLCGGTEKSLKIVEKYFEGR